MELVVVIVIVGVLSAFAAPRFFGDDVFTERGYLEELTGALRAAQRTAVASGCPVRFVFDATGYAAMQQAASSGRCASGSSDWSVPLRLSTGEDLAGSVPSGVAVSPATTVVFAPSGATTLGSDRAVTVGSHSFTLIAGSGYVDVP